MPRQQHSAAVRTMAAPLLGAMCILAAVPEATAYGSSDSVRQSDIQTLTLRRGRMTKGRRADPVPQLTCVGGDACSRWEPDVVQCRNMGSDGTELQWKCDADMPQKYRFGQVTVTCEGYKDRHDPFVLKGSCGLEYELWLTEAGRQAGQHSQGGSRDYYSAGTQYASSRGSYGGWSDGSSDGGSLWTLLMLGIAFYLGYKVLQSCMAPPQAQPRSWGSGTTGGNGGNGGNGGGGGGGPGWGGGGGGGSGGGGGGGGGGGDASCNPPPSYDQAQGSSSAYGGTGQGAGPGFWTGAGLGGLLGYMFGGNRGGYGYNNYGSPYAMGGGWGGGYGGWGGGGFRRRGWGGSSWGSGGGGWGGGGASTSSWGSGGSSGASGSRTASGYGGTRNR